MNTTESAIEAYLKHYGRIDHDDMCDFFGIDKKKCTNSNFVYNIFRFFWQQRGFWKPHFSNQYTVKCENITQVCKAIAKIKK